MKLVIESLSKSYGPTRALDSVSFTAAAGCVLGVLGENGAGKSTLVKILAGAVRRDSGAIRLGDEAFAPTSPRAALRAGVALVPQELAYLPNLTVAENIVVGRLPTRYGLVSPRRVRIEAAGYAEQAGVSAALDSPISALSLAEAQLVEIAKGLARRARILLLDEPTAALSYRESQHLFDRVRRLTERGVTVLVISHRLDEVLAHTDAVVVLRDGVVSLDLPTRSVTKRDLVGAMLGRRPVAAARARTQRDTRVAVVELANVSHRASTGLRDVSARVDAGELVGAFSLRGGGQEALVETLAGLRPHDRGQVVIAGTPCPPLRGATRARRAGVVFVPADRKHQGLVLTASLVHNTALAQLNRLSHRGFVSHRAERAAFAEVARAFNIRYRTPDQAVSELSGGNQQKVLVGGRVAVPHRLLVLHEPTRGVDVGARRDIHNRLVGLAESGGGVLFATTDVEEAVELSDRLYILRDGAVIAELSGADKTAARAISLAVGGTS